MLGAVGDTRPLSAPVVGRRGADRELPVPAWRPGGSARGGASPWTTDGGSDESPMRSRVSRLTDHVSAAVTASPASAATVQRSVRRVTTHNARGRVTGLL